VLTHYFLQLEDHSIDASILIEPNGDKYAFFSGEGGVKYRKINSMEDGTGGPVVQLTQCVVDNIIINPGEVGTVGWTEAPTAFKMDGKYYITYTGNHYLRSDYQIHLAIGDNLDNIVPYINNPWIINSFGEWTGTGNCYPVLGPNLKDYYYTYHVKKGARISVDPVYRKLMVDKVVFKNDVIETLAPTFDNQLIPEKADYENDFSKGLEGFEQEGGANWQSFQDKMIKVTAPDGDGNRLYTLETTGSNFVAETYLNMVSYSQSAEPMLAFIHGGDNGQDINWMIGLTYQDNEEKMFFYNAKNNLKEYIAMPDNFSVKQWVDLRVEKRDTIIKVYVNNVEILRKNVDDFGSGKLGFSSENCTGLITWLAYSNL
jgi:hypothetical protein